MQARTDPFPQNLELRKLSHVTCGRRPPGRSLLSLHYDAMATVPDYSRPTTPENGANGIMTPRTPKNSGFALTEYTANPSPPPESPRPRTNDVVPDAFLLPNGYPDYLRLILTSRVYEVVRETPLTHAINLSNRLECNVMLKREDLQPVFSFKLRGAYNKMAHLDPKDRWKGVIACSAGMTMEALNST
jgi:threonine dehydratase